MISSLTEEVKMGEKQKVNNAIWNFEMLSFCPDKQVLDISNRMHAFVNLLKP